MPTGPRGERRPADVIGNAIMSAKLSVGDITEPLKKPSGRVRSGTAGAEARAAALTAEQRRAIGKQGAEKRWSGKNV